MCVSKQLHFGKTILFCLNFIVLGLLVGCGYTQPDRTVPHAVVQPRGMVRLLAINGERVIEPGGEYRIRVTPGEHIVTLEYGHNSKLPMSGTESNRGNMAIEVKAGYHYFILAKSNYKNALFGLFKQAKSWKPMLTSGVPFEESSQ